MKSIVSQSLKLTEIDRINDDRLGDIVIYRQESDTNDRPFVLSKKSLYDSNSKLQELIKDLEKRVQSTGFYLVPVLDYEQEDMKNMCATHYSLTVYMPYTEDSLKTQIKIQRVRKSPITLSDLCYLLYQSLKGLRQLHQLGETHESITPAWIVRAKIGYSLMNDPFKHRNTLYNLSDKKQVYASPEQFKEALTFKRLQYDKNKADVFSLGLTLLSASTLRHVSSIYDFQTGDIRQSELQAMIDQMDIINKDNLLFTSSVKHMLNLDPAQRPDTIKLLSRMPPFDEVKEHISQEFEGYARFSKYVELPTSMQQNQFIIDPEYDTEHESNWNLEESPQFGSRQAPARQIMPVNGYQHDDSLSFIDHDQHSYIMPLKPVSHRLDITENRAHAEHSEIRVPSINGNNQEYRHISNIDHSRLSNIDTSVMQAARKPILSAPFLDTEKNAPELSDTHNHESPALRHLQAAVIDRHETAADVSHVSTQAVRKQAYVRHAPNNESMANRTNAPVENLFFPHDKSGIKRNTSILEPVDPSRVRSMLIKAGHDDFDHQLAEYSGVNLISYRK